MRHTVTEQDKTNGYITIDPELNDSITNVVRIFPFNTGFSGGIFGVQYQIFLNDIYALRQVGGGGSGDVVTNYVLSQQMLRMIELMFSSVKQIRYNRHQNRIYINDNWSEIDTGTILLFDVFMILDPEEYTDIYNDIFLKKYITTLIKMQWGQNLSKFSGVQLPGGVELNGENMVSEAKDELEQLHEEMELKYESPVDFYIG